MSGQLSGAASDEAVRATTTLTHRHSDHLELDAKAQKALEDAADGAASFIGNLKSTWDQLANKVEDENASLASQHREDVPSFPSYDANDLRDLREMLATSLDKVDKYVKDSTRQLRQEAQVIRDVTAVLTPK